MLTGCLECSEDSCSVLTVPTLNLDPHFKRGRCFSGGSESVKNLPANAGDPGSIPGSGRPPRGGNGNPFQYSCLENSMNRGALWVTVHGVARVGHNLVTKPASSPHFKIRLHENNAHGHASNGCLGWGKGISESQAPITTLAAFPKTLCGLNRASFIFISITLRGGSKRILLQFIRVFCLYFPLRVVLFFFFNFTYYLFLALLGLHCCMGFSCSRGSSLVAVCKLLTGVASLAAGHGL